jgi:pimeloyl-ACP methyl ester carboxylesterase
MKNLAIKSNSPLRSIPKDYVPNDECFWFQIPSGLDKGKWMFYRDSSLKSTNSNQTVLFVHGNPECSYTYRKIIHEIIERIELGCRIVAMDHIGFGLSDQATYEMVSMDHARNLLELVKYLDLRNITLVVHDWGGPIGIGALLKETERISNLVILNSTVFPIPKNGMTFETYPIDWLGWCYTPYIIPDKFWGNFAAYAIFTNPNKPIPLLSNMVKNIALMERDIYQNTHSIAQRVFKTQFNSKMNVKSSKRLVKQTKFWGYGNKYTEPQLGKRDTSQFYHMIQESITMAWGPKGDNIGIKALIGRWDPLGQNAVLEQWIEYLPQLKGNIQIFQNTGHFIEEKKYKEIADAILELLKSRN